MSRSGGLNIRLQLDRQSQSCSFGLVHTKPSTLLHALRGEAYREALTGFALPFTEGRDHLRLDPSILHSMATFLTELFTSIFTPGPTQSLLVATNVSFAALQVVLLLLLILTYSVHFIVLSVLSAGLWWSINWFAAELELSKRKEQEQEAKKLDEAQHQRFTSSDDGSGTETEGGEDHTRRAHLEPVAHATTPSGDAEARLRKPRSLASSTGDLSTDSEWDKVDEAETRGGG